MAPTEVDDAATEREDPRPNGRFPNEVWMIIIGFLHRLMLLNMSLTCKDYHSIVVAERLRHIILMGTQADLASSIRRWIALVTQPNTMINLSRFESANIMVLGDHLRLTSNQNLARCTPWSRAADHLRRAEDDETLVNQIIKLLQFFNDKVRMPKFRRLALDITGLSKAQVFKLMIMLQTAIFDIQLDEFRLNSDLNRSCDTELAKMVLFLCQHAKRGTTNGLKRFHFSDSLQDSVGRHLADWHGSSLTRLHITQWRHVLSPVFLAFMGKHFPNLEWLSNDGGDLGCTAGEDIVLKQIKRQGPLLAKMPRLTRFAITMIGEPGEGSDRYWDMGNRAYKKFIEKYFELVPGLEFVTFRIKPPRLIEGKRDKASQETQIGRRSMEDTDRGWPDICG